MSSSNLTPPLPASGAGILSAGQMAVIQFDLRVNNGVPPGTVIRNQASVTTAELPRLLTDGDGNPATGPEPTVVVVAGPQLMRITKDVAVVGGGPAIAGATLEYVVKATNSGTVPAYAVVIRDDLAVPNPGYLTFVNGSYTMNDSTDGITVVDSLLTADYSTTHGALPPGGSITLRFRAVLNTNLAIGTKVTNTGKVYWNDPQQTASASVSIDVGGMVGVGILNGRRGTTPISTRWSMPRNVCSNAGPSSSIETARWRTRGPRMRPVLMSSPESYLTTRPQIGTS